RVGPEHPRARRDVPYRLSGSGPRHLRARRAASGRSVERAAAAASRAGLIDPCPLWDEDGRAYLVHGWARSRARVKNRLSLLEVTPDLSAALSPSQVIIDGDDLPGMLTLEGPKAYRQGGWYWIYAPAGGVADGYQVV